MGKAPTIPWHKRLQVLKYLPIFNPDGSLKSKAHPVWLEAHKKLGGLELDTIYFDVFQNRHGLMTDILRKKGLVVGKLKAQDKMTNSHKSSENVEAQRQENQIAKLEAMIKCNCETVEAEVTCDEDSSDFTEHDETDCFSLLTVTKNPNPQNFCALHFTIHFNETEWKLLKPVKGRLPKFQWTSIIASKIYDETSLRCAYIFKVGKVYKILIEKYIDFHGFCKQKDCQTYIYGVATKKPENDEDGITFDISTYDTSKLYHKTKRPFMGARRRKAGKELVYMTAEQYRHEMVHDIMSFSEDQERPDIPLGVNLRAVKAEGLRLHLGITGPKEPIRSLLFLMGELDFIREVSLNPFRVSYWFDKQITLWDDLAPLDPVLKLDATGSLVKKVVINEEPSAYIYLYQLITTVGNKYVPLFQMISSKHDNNIINQWLNEWKDRVTFNPTGVVCDDGLALLYALCESLNDCTWKAYLSFCLQILQGCKDVPVLKCKMGLDRAHITKTPSTWKCVKDKNDKSFTDFVTRSIALASICETLEGVREILLATFVICESETMEKGSICEEKLEWYLNECENFGIDCEEEKSKQEKKQGDDQEIFTKLENSQEEIDLHMHSNDVRDYIISVHDEAIELVNASKTEVTVDNKNNFYCPEIVKNLIFLYCQFPAWTSVMLKYFCSSNKVATSADMEAYFKDLKNTHRLQNVIAANTFVMYHGRIIDAQTKIANCKLNQILNEQDDGASERDISQLESEITSILKEIENITCSNETKEEFVKIRSSIDVGKLHVKKEVEANKVPAEKVKEPNPNTGKFHIHLRNGHLDHHVYINDKKVIFANTCAYDSGISVLAFAYETNSIFKKYVDENIDDNGLFFESIAGYCNRTMDMEKFYENRGLLLLDRHDNKNECYYDCRANINGLLSSLLKEQMCCTTDVLCECGHHRVDRHRILFLDHDTAKALVDSKAINNINRSEETESILRECILNLFNDEDLYCRQCRNQVRTAHGVKIIGSFVAVDLGEVFEDPALIRVLSTTRLPTNLIVQRKNLVLSGFIVYEPPAGKDGLGHYVAYCYNRVSDDYEVKDDTQMSQYSIKTLPGNLSIRTMIYTIDDHETSGER